MRVTNSMLVKSFLSNINGNTNRLENYYNQLSTGKKITKLSQDPIGVTRSLQARTELNKIGKYIQNTDDARSWLTQSETALMEMNSILKRAYELAIDGANDSKTAEGREAILNEVTELKEQLVKSANTSYAGRYVFGGYNTTSRPFEIDEATGSLKYNGVAIESIKDGSDTTIKNEHMQYEVGENIFLSVNIPGLELLGITPGVDGDDLYTAIFDFETALKNDDQEAISDSIDRLQDQQGNVLALLAEVGGRDNRLELISSRLENDKINYTQVKSKVEDVDYTETIMEFVMAQMVYRASLSVGANIIQPTLVDFLR